jgi:O-acetylhomoserine (thiol)-lyase
LRARTILLRDLGSALSPFNAFQILQGVETLPLRMPHHCANGEAVAKSLTTRPDITRVIHCNGSAC